MPVSRYLGIPYWKPYTALSANNNHVSTSKHYKLFPKQKLIQKFFSHIHDIPVLSAGVKQFIVQKQTKNLYSLQS